MSDDIKRVRIETKAIIIGYAMSRLDERYLSVRRHATWRQVYGEASRILTLPATSFKNLRDEFDPVHANSRQGWHQRPLRTSRQKVLDELHELSDDALIELVERILNRDDEAITEAIDSLAVVSRVAYNVAERLLTGRRAEEYFVANSAQIVGVESVNLIDLRISARGFDFGVHEQPQLAIEVKGLKQVRSSIQFTDREWAEARVRRDDYWLVVIGALASSPTARVIRDPHSVLEANCVYQQSISAVWRSTVSVQV